MCQAYVINIQGVFFTIGILYFFFVLYISGFFWGRFRKNSLKKELTVFAKLTDFPETHAKKVQNLKFPRFLANLI